MRYLSWHGFIVDSQNIPLALPGVYRLLHIESELSYIGSAKDVAKRLFEHARGGSNVPTVYEALQQHHRSAFLAEPLYYHPVPTSRKEAGLWIVEQEMIDAYNSIQHGWNQPCPDVAVLSQRAEAVAKRQATENSLTTKARRSAEMNRRYADPDYKQRHLNSVLHANSNPERNAKIGASRIGKIWITNGIQSLVVSRNEPIPNGWWKGTHWRGRLGGSCL